MAKLHDSTLEQTDVARVLGPRELQDLNVVTNKKKAWSEEDIERLNALVASGASALRASVALKRSLLVTKAKARDLGIPFRSEAELKKERQQLLQKSSDAPRMRASLPANEDI